MQRLAQAYLDDGRVNVAVQATPGRMVSFYGTKADIYHESDMPAVLSMPRVIVVVDLDHVDWLPRWLQATRSVQATVQLPDGFELGPSPGYEVRKITSKKKWSKGSKEA